jgi:peptidoglycan/LPS O-acetylase OafA/YrhL
LRKPILAAKATLAPLTGLRAVAAFSILLSHTMTWCTPFNNTAVFGILSGIVGVYGMPLFFVLSGFVIHYNYSSLFWSRPYATAFRAFLTARFARIYPLYIFFALFGAISDFTVNWVHVEPSQFVRYLFHAITLTQSWVYAIVVNGHVLLANGFGLAWSLSTEFFFYLAYPVFVVAILGLRRPFSIFVVIVAFSLVIVGFLTVAYLHMGQLMEVARLHVTDFIDAEKDFANSFYRWLFYYSPYVRIWEFVLGCLTAQLFLRTEQRAISKSENGWGFLALYLALALLGVFGLLQAIPVRNGLVRGLVAFFSLNFGGAVPIASLIFCAARYRSRVGRLLSLPWILWLGEISYSIYCVHTWTLRPFIRPAVDIDAIFALDAALRIGFAVAFTVIVASATYSIIEMPCRRYLRVKLMRGAIVASVGSGATAVTREA